jgi:hypothetical protein
LVEGKMGLKESSPQSLDERLSHDAHNNVVYANFEGMNIEIEEEADKLADYSTVTSRRSGARFTSRSTTTTSTSGRPPAIPSSRWSSTTRTTTSSPRPVIRPTPSSDTSSRRTSPRPTSSSESTATSTRRARACECGICSSLARIARLRGSAGWYGRVRSGQAAAASSVKCVQNTVIWAAKVEHLGGPLQREECLLHPAPINNELSGGAPVPQSSGPELDGASRSADAG